MGEALFWGLLAGSSLILGGAIGLWLPLPREVRGLIMGFGAGVLISAVAYELVDDAFEAADGFAIVAIGLLVGATTFFLGDLYIDRMGGADRKRSDSKSAPAGVAALAIVLGIVLDGIPESAVIGLTLLEGAGVSAAMIVAVFLSNLPEAIAATTGLARSGWSQRKILALWVGVTLVSGLSALLGFVIFDGASASWLAFVLAFAAGAILTMLADTMLPEAFERSGKWTGLATTLGFAVAFAVTALE
jgi:zinc transporter, ZIP family